MSESEFERIFVAPYAAAIEAKTRRAQPGWRPLERALIEFLKSHGVRTINIAAEPHVDVVRHHEFDEAVITRLSIETLARYIAEEIGR